MDRICIIGRVDVSKIDLNLLVVFDAVMRQRNVTRAAASLGLSQSAVSGALGRLRAILRDPLLVRTARGVVPTARAERLAGPVRVALSSMERALSDDAPFDPGTADRTFRVSSSDYGTLVLLPRLFARVAKVAPRVRLSVSALGTHDAPDDLLGGDLDLAIGVFRRLPAALRRRTLARERMACLVQRSRASRGAFEMDAYLRADHVLASAAGKTRGSVDEALDRAGRTRRVVLVLPNWTAAADAVARRDLVLTLPERVARKLAASNRLAVRPAPRGISSELVIEAIWHERRHHEPAHSWLREQVYAVAAEA